MIGRLGQMSMRTGLRMVFLLQLAIAIVLVAVVALQKPPRFLMPGVDLPGGPVSPGDQRRIYREDQPKPDYLFRREPGDLKQPDDVPERLQFEATTLEALGDVVVLTGAIQDGDLFRLQGFLEELADQPDYIVLNSPGGHVHEALAIGRYLRAEEHKTAVPGGAYCFSACPYILASGTERSVSRRGAVGMHQHYYETPGYMPVFLAVEDIQRGQGETLEYLIEMGIEPSVMLFSLQTPPQEIYVLLEQELEDTKMATDLID